MRVLESAEHYSRHIRARYRRYSEKFLGAESEEETHAERVNARTSLMRKFMFFPFEVYPKKYSETDRERKETCGFEESYPDLRSSAAFEARHYAQRDYAENVVDNRRAYYRLSYPGVELAYLFKRFDGYAHARRGEDGSDKNRVEKFFVRVSRKSVKEKHRTQSSQSDGDENAAKCYERCGDAAVFKVIEVGFESARKENENYADLAERV